MNPRTGSLKDKQDDKLLTRPIKKKRERTKINKITNEKGEGTTDTKYKKKKVRKYYKQLYANRLDNLEEMDKFLETQSSKTESKIFRESEKRDYN